MGNSKGRIDKAYDVIERILYIYSKLSVITTFITKKINLVIK